MADLCCKSLEFPSFSVISKPRQFSSGLEKFKNNWMRTRTFHLTLICKLTQQEVFVVSTHENSDGSVLFRFGQVEKGNETMKSSQTREESEDEYAVLKALNGEGESCSSRTAFAVLDGDSSMENYDTFVEESSGVEERVTLVGSEEETVEEIDSDTSKLNLKNEEASGNLAVPVTEVEDKFTHKNVVEDLFLTSNITEVEAADSSERSHSQATSKEELFLSSGAAMLPHPSKALTDVEDAYFISGETWLGVADGVSLWSLEGTKPGVFAKELIKNCERLISNSNAVESPLELLIRSVSETHSSGSSTCLISRFDGQALHAANVGDSRFIVLRHGSVYKKSSPMNHLFHFPFHIQCREDLSSAAQTYMIDLIEDDVIITATDGLFDNLYDQEITSIVCQSFLEDKNLEETAKQLALKAQETGRSAGLRTPFSDEAQAAGFAGCIGGRLDDVAVIVSRVRRRSTS